MHPKRTMLLGSATLAICTAFACSLAPAFAQIKLRYATWDPPHHEMRKFGVDLWVKSIAKVTDSIGQRTTTETRSLLVI